ncbi:MAG: polysaccharide biosynthesis C-terminal domain-containing protein [Candidatus Hodarchaeota archaeon]
MVKTQNLKQSRIASNQRNFFLAGFLICILAMFGAQILFSFLMVRTSAQGTPADPTDVLYIAPSSDLDDSNVLKALDLDPSFNTTTTFTNDYTNFDCVIYDTSNVLNPADSDALKTWVENEGVLILISSLDLTQDPEFLVNLSIINSPSASDAQADAIGDVPSTGQGNAFMNTIQWNSMPEMRNYTDIETSNLNVTSIVLLEKYLQVSELGANKDPLIIEKKLGTGTILYFSAYLGGNVGQNQHVKLWPYFNYMIYSSINYLVGNEILAYGNWAYSPVPHFTDQVIMAIYVIIMLVIAVAAFMVVKKRSARTRIDATSLEAAKVEVKKEEDEIELDEDKKALIAKLMASGKPHQEIYAELAKISDVDLTDHWEQVGTHKQIGGFLFGFFMAIILIIPQLVITGLLLPQYILPFPQVNGWFDLTKNFFNAIWVVFDVGTSVALAKYFAQYRIKKPEKAIHYIQIFVWWQMISGVVQIAIVAFIGSIVYPQTYLAHLSWFFILHSMIQYPGFFLVFQYVFQGMQRTDYQLLTQTLYNIIFNILCQIGAILIFRVVFKDIPRFGEEFGAGIGFVIGQYLSEWGTFFFTLGLFKKMKFSVGTIFRIDFTKEELKEALAYGLRYMIGSVWVPGIWLFQVFLQSIYVRGYATETGYFNLVYTFGQVVAVVGLFMEGLMAGVSEAHSHKKKKLLKLITSQGLKWANFMAFFVITLLLVLGWRFVIGFSGPEWTAAVKFIPWVLIFQLLGPYSWQGDKMLAGAGETGKLAIAWIIEQVVRAVLLFLLLPRFQMLGVLWAYIPALVAKDVSLWIFIYRYVSKPKPYFWITWISPAICAGIIFVVFETIAQLIWQADILTTALLFLMGIFGGLYLYSFLSGFFGHWDKNTLDEFKKSVGMVHLVGFLAKGMYLSIKAGARISPLHDKFSIDIFDDALREAHELEIEKKILKI